MSSVVFDRHQVGRMGGDFFVRNWEDLLMPSRDDTVILPEDRGVVLFYCHEDEFEFGQQLKARSAPQPESTKSRKVQPSVR
jgi:hypothetical protein